MGWSDTIDDDIRIIKKALAFSLTGQLVGRRVEGYFDVQKHYLTVDVKGTITEVDDDLGAYVTLDEPTVMESRWKGQRNETVEVVRVSVEDAIYNLKEKDDVEK